MQWSPEYGPNSPFSGEERATIDAIVAALMRSPLPEASGVLGIIREHFERLEAFGALLARFPSPLTRHRLGSREQSLGSLADGLCQSTPASFEFQAPTRAIVGRALDMAEMNFYRLLGYACDEALVGHEVRDLRAEATTRLHVVIYTKLVEEVLGDIVSDSSVSRAIRYRAVLALAQIWDRRLTYRTRELFPLLEATWEARQRIHIVGGTLLGVQEMFELFRAGCDPEFVDFFVRPNPSDDEVAAFREFLFGTIAEELDSLAERMQRDRVASIPLPETVTTGPTDSGTLLYQFFRTRFLQATARRLARLPGPKRTAEGYVMIEFLGRSSEDELAPAQA